jgi:hypothetical protein
MDVNMFVVLLMLQAKNSGPYPVEFDGLVGKKCFSLWIALLAHRLFLMGLTRSREFAWSLILLKHFVLSVHLPVQLRC